MLWKILLIGTSKDFSHTLGRATLLLEMGYEVVIELVSLKFNQDVGPLRILQPILRLLPLIQVKCTGRSHVSTCFSPTSNALKRRP